MKNETVLILLSFLFVLAACQTEQADQPKPPTKSTTIEQAGKEVAPQSVQSLLPEGMMIVNHHGIDEARKADITGDGVEDLVALVYRPGSNQAMDLNDVMQLMVFKGAENGYETVYKSGNLTCESFLTSPKAKLIVGDQKIQYLHEGFNFDITGEFEYDSANDQMVMGKKILTYKQDQIPDGSGTVTFKYKEGIRFSEWFRRDAEGTLQPFTTQSEKLETPVMSIAEVNLDILQEQ